MTTDLRTTEQADRDLHDRRIEINREASRLFLIGWESNMAAALERAEREWTQRQRAESLLNKVMPSELSGLLVRGQVL